MVQRSGNLPDPFRIATPLSMGKPRNAAHDALSPLGSHPLAFTLWAAPSSHRLRNATLPFGVPLLDQNNMISGGGRKLFYGALVRAASAVLRSSALRGGGRIRCLRGTPRSRPE